MMNRHRKEPEEMTPHELAMWWDDPLLFRELEAAGKLADHSTRNEAAPSQASGSVPSIRRKEE